MERNFKPSLRKEERGNGEGKKPEGEVNKKVVSSLELGGNLLGQPLLISWQELHIFVSQFHILVLIDSRAFSPYPALNSSLLTKLPAHLETLWKSTALTPVQGWIDSNIRRNQNIFTLFRISNAAPLQNTN